MNSNQIFALASFVCIGYTWGCINHGWTSPADIARDIWRNRRGHPAPEDENRSSEDVDTDTGPDVEDMSGHAGTEHAGPLRPPQTLHLRNGPRTFHDGILEVSQESIHTEKLKFNAQSVRRQPGESGVAWARRQIELEILRPTEMYRVGAREFGVNERTIRRWIKIVTGPDVKIVDSNEASNDKE